MGLREEVRKAFDDIKVMFSKEEADKLTNKTAAIAKENINKNSKKEAEDNAQEANLSEDKDKKEEPVKVVLAADGDESNLINSLIAHFGIDKDVNGYYNISLDIWGDGSARMYSSESKDVQLSEEDKTEIKTELESQISSLKEDYEAKLSAEKTKYDNVLAEKEELNTKYITLKSDTKETIIDAPVAFTKVELSENPSQREILIAMSEEKRKSNKN